MKFAPIDPVLFICAGYVQRIPQSGDSRVGIKQIFGTLANGLLDSHTIGEWIEHATLQHSTTGARVFILN
jgi:hypothetical protein